MFIKLFDNLNEEDEIPEFLYHGTFRPLLPKINVEGLKIEGTKKNYPDAVGAGIYLDRTPEGAEAWAEESETVPEDWLDKIVVLEIATKYLDKLSFGSDPNVLDSEDTLAQTFVYKEDIPAKAISR